MNKQILLTGGTKGIGKAIANCLAKEGYDLWITYASDLEIATQTACDLESKYAIHVHLLQADISQPESIDKKENWLKDKSLFLDAIIFNAGMTCRD